MIHYWSLRMSNCMQLQLASNEKWLLVNYSQPKTFDFLADGESNRSIPLAQLMYITTLITPTPLNWQRPKGDSMPPGPSPLENLKLARRAWCSATCCATSSHLSFQTIEKTYHFDESIWNMWIMDRSTIWYKFRGRNPPWTGDYFANGGEPSNNVSTSWSIRQPTSSLRNLSS